ncbi:hypothetical protein [uncultured Clostridium sp.]|uniref:hypothetical protein n=1 Tax=uncultured Clostridium sp. TaxID=59620 RepID=UPI00258A2F4D|nr:hypothetical protein [uncultured Clostridium sp.]
MKKKFFGIVCMLTIVLVACYLFVSNINNETLSLTGIYLDDNNQLHGEAIDKSKNNDSKYIGYIEGNFISNTNKEITENFSLNKIYFQNLSLEIPDYFQTFPAVEADNLISLVTKTDDIFNHYRKDGISVYIADNDSNYTIEKYIENIKESNKFPGLVRKLQDINVDGNILKVYENGDYKDAVAPNVQSKFKVYTYMIFQDNKIYTIAYLYEDEVIGKKVIDILNKSITITKQ